MSRLQMLVAVSSVILGASAWAGSVTIPNTFTANTAAVADEVNDNFTAIKTAVDDNDARTTTNTQDIATISANYVSGNGDLSTALTGTVTVGVGDAAVTGVDTLFSSELNVGDPIKITGETFTVASIVDDLNLVLDVAHSAGALSVTAYKDGDLLTVKNSNNENQLVIDKSGNADLSGYFIRRVARATGFNEQDNTDEGLISTRVLNITKARDDTAIRIGYSDNFRTYNASSSTSCSWELRVDDDPTDGTDAISCPGGVLAYANFDLTPNNYLRLGSVFGYCEGLTAGSYQIQVWVSTTPGQSSANCHTGWESRWTLEAEEVY
ncbi:MAG: hypothetical protein GXP17_07370 [Gammaproteobacteria bacterium]|nr:hypothetical protein [Gammaproteobacteria bacterium]